MEQKHRKWYRDVARFTATDRLSEMLTKEQEQAAIARVLQVLQPRFGSPEEARIWMETGSVPGFGGKSAMDLIAEGDADAVCEAIQAIDAGIHQ